MQMVKVSKMWDFSSSQTTGEEERKDEPCSVPHAQILLSSGNEGCLIANDREAEGTEKESAVQASHTSANIPDL